MGGEDQRTALEELGADHTSRKRFLRMAGGGGAATALGMLLTACGGTSQNNVLPGKVQTDLGEPPKPERLQGKQGTGAGEGQSSASEGGDLGILNYALTLEYIEAAFYRDVADSGQISDSKTLNLAQRFGEQEQSHVDALKATVQKLGGKPVKEPQTDFTDVISGGKDKILMTAAMVENIGAAAYLGQASSIKSKDVLAAALSIHSVEARHAAALNKLIGEGFTGKNTTLGSIPDGPFAKPMDKQQVLAAVKPFLA